jgi:hypothetical protein
MNVHFKMKPSVKKFLFAQFICLAVGLAALAAPAQTAASFGNLPLYFEGGSSEFVARGRDAQFSISPTEAQFILQKSDSTGAVKMQFVGANPQAHIAGDARLSGKINYLTGNNPAQWRSGIPIFAKVRVAEIYPGIGLVYYGNQRQLEYDFSIAPGANPDSIAIHFDGTDKISVNAQGELVLKLGAGEILQPKPEIYQTVNGLRKEISGGYKILDAHTVAFAVGNYDRALPLVIDPVLSYATYFGGTLGETAWAVAVNPTDGSIYIAGQTFSKFLTNNLPFSTTNAYQTNFVGGKLAGDAFVARFDSFGSNLMYLTYLGGSADDAAYALALDGAGDAYVTGFTDSTNFPVTNSIPGGVPGLVNSTNISGKFDKSFGFFPGDAFVAELNPGGSSLIYSTYLGGSAVDSANGIAVDAAGNAYVTGYTYSTNFPTTNAIQKNLGATNSAFSVFFNANAFVTEIASNGSGVVFSTYLGGTNLDEGNSIAVDPNGFIYVVGFASSTNFPTTNFISQSFTSFFGTNLYNGSLLNGSTNNNQNKRSPAFDAFVTKYSPSGSNYIYSTFLGGTNDDVATSIAVDASGAAYVTGWTISTNFPNSITNLISSGLTNNINGLIITTNAFLTKITNGIGTAAGIAYSVVFGGSAKGGANDVGYGVAVDPAGNAFVVGAATSTNFPASHNSGFLRATNSGNSDVFVTAFNTNASAVLYSVLLGGAQNDFGYGIALDSSDSAYIVGSTTSTNFPTTAPFQSFRNGTNDAFVAKIILTSLPPAITTQPTNQLVETANSAIFNVTATGTAPLNYQWQLNGTNLVDGLSINGATINGATINGATNATLTISDAQTNDSGNYLVIVTNYGGSVTSSVAVLTVTSAPFLTLQPTNQTVGVGSSVTFSVAGFSTQPSFLQWLKDGADLTDGTNSSGSIISGSTNSAVLTISNVQTSDDGDYLFVVTNNWGSATSVVATLTVLTSPSFTSITSVGGGGSFILSGFGGTSAGTYFVLTSTNLAMPLALWTPIATNQFGGHGQFVFTNTAPTGTPQQFYILQIQQSP